MHARAQAGACFGLSAAACRTGFLLAARTSWLAAPAGLGASAAFTSSGFMIQVHAECDAMLSAYWLCAPDLSDMYYSSWRQNEQGSCERAILP